MTNLNDDFYVVAYEPGAENPSLPTWANHQPNPAKLASQYDSQNITREALSDVPGAFILHNVLSEQECHAFIELSERLGYLEDAAVSLPRKVRHNDNVTWVCDEASDSIIWQRVEALCQQDLDIFNGQKPVGINARFRFYRYSEGDYFKTHTDGAWPGSRVVDGKLITNAYDDRYSQMTFLILLNDDFEGGATRFLVDAENPERPARGRGAYREVDVRTPAGSVLCFPHGYHPLHCLHSSEPLTKGVKYIIRSDMLFTI